MTVPWLVIAGEEDDLSPIEHTYALAASTRGPVNLLVYEGERHSLQALDAGLGGSAASNGPNWYTWAADWLLDRAHGVPVQDRFDYVASDGQVTRREVRRSAVRAP